MIGMKLLVELPKTVDIPKKMIGIVVNLAIKFKIIKYITTFKKKV